MKPIRILLAVCLPWLGVGPAGARAAVQAEHTVRWGADSDAPLFGVEVVAQDRSHTRLRIEVNGFESKTVDVAGVAREVISVPGMPPLCEAGAPDLPRLIRTLHIPSDAGVALKLVNRVEQTFDDVDVAPSPGRQLYGDGHPVARRRGPAYGADAWFPASPVQLGSTGILRDVRLVKLLVNPFAYHPQRRQLRVTTHLVVDLLYDTSSLPHDHALATSAGSVLPPLSGAFEPTYRTLLMNYSPAFLGERKDLRTMTSDGGVSPLSGAPAPDRMLIVTVSDFVPVLADYVAWKQGEGLDVEVDATSAPAGVDAIRGSIQAQYDGAGLTYVLLVGDTDHVPSPQESIIEGRSSDPSYGLLAGDDYYGDVMVSRLSVVTTNELANQLARIMRHEQAAFSSTDWIRHAVVAASDDYEAPEHAAAIEAGMVDHPQHFTNVIMLLESESATAAHIKTAIEATGINIFIYVGHGNANGFYSVPFQIADALALTNSQGRFPMMHTVGCSVGVFDRPGGDCFAEAIMKAGSVAAPAGPVAILASVEDMWVGSGEVAQRHAFTNLYYATDDQTYGALCFEATALAMSQTDDDGAETLYRQWHLFGDGSTPIWKRSPVRVHITLPDAASEGDGLLAGGGTVTADEVMTTNVTVTLRSSDTGELTVPPAVVILQGESNAVFDLTIVDDGLLDGSRAVEISAAAALPDLGIARHTVVVHDNESAVLSVDMPAGAVEGDGVLTAVAVVQSSAAAPEPLWIELQSSDTTEVSVAAGVVLPAGQTNHSFTLTIMDDSAIDGDQVVTVQARVEHWTTGQDTITIADNEGSNLLVTLPSWMGEGDGVLAAAGQVSISGTRSNDTIVSLTTDDATELRVPSNAVIVAGATAAAFDVTVVDDGIADGAQTVWVAALAARFAGSQVSGEVADDEIVGCAVESVGSQTSGVPFNLVVSATDTNGQRGAYAGSLALEILSSTGTVSAVPAVIGPLEGGRWSGTVTLRGASPDAWFAVDDQAGHTGASAPFSVVPQPPTDVFGPAPPHLGTWVPQDTALSWKMMRRGLAVNGGFERGDLTGWYASTTVAQGFVVNNGTVDPASPDGALQPYAGAFSMVSDPVAQGICQIVQTLAIPNDATSATLSWVDRIRNHRSHYLDPYQEYRVEIRDALGTSLAVVFSTDPGDARFSGWTQRNADLSPYVGQHVQVAFVAQSTQYPLNIHLDEVRATTDVDETPMFDVYLGRDADLDTDDLLGVTEAATWDLSPLAPLADYSWQVISRSGGAQTPNPVWSFRTAGLDHFTWSTIASPRTSGVPFPVSLAAEDAGDVLLASFTDAVALTAWADKTVSAPVVITEIDTGNPDRIELTNVSTGEIDLAGWSLCIYDRSVGTWPAPVLTFSFPSGAVSPRGGVFVVSESGPAPGIYPAFGAGDPIAWVPGGKAAVLLLDATSNAVDFVCVSDPDPWAITNPVSIDTTEWAGSPVPGGAALQRSGGSDNESAGDWVVTNTADIGTLNSGLVTPFGRGVREVPMLPSNASAFVSGVWSGAVTLLEPANSVFLRADHDRGFSGRSELFEVQAPVASRALLLIIR